MAEPTESILNKLTKREPLGVRALAEMPVNGEGLAEAATFGKPVQASPGQGFTLRFSVDGDAVLDGSGLRDGEVKLSRLMDGVSVTATIKF